VYEREPFVFLANNTRVTFDYMITRTKVCTSFFDKRIISLSPIIENQLGVLEIKYNDVLIGPLQDLLKKLNIHPVANSKYTLARLNEY
jgi:hypothetical protein